MCPNSEAVFTYRTPAIEHGEIAGKVLCALIHNYCRLQHIYCTVKHVPTAFFGRIGHSTVAVSRYVPDCASGCPALHMRYSSCSPFSLEICTVHHSRLVVLISSRINALVEVRDCIEHMHIHIAYW